MDFLLELLEIWKTPLSTLIGVLAGFGLSFFNERLRERKTEQKRKKKTKQLLVSIIEEIRFGINRLKTILDTLRESDFTRFSPARIYTGVWDATKADFVEHIDNTNEFRAILDCYRRFDLINYNAERVLRGDKKAAGLVGGFAEEHLPKIEMLLKELEDSSLMKEV